MARFVETVYVIQPAGCEVNGAAIGLDAAQLDQVNALLPRLPPPGDYFSLGCDGVHCRLELRATGERYSWWAPDGECRPELAALGELAALLDAWAAATP